MAAEGATCGTGSAARSRYVRRTGLRLAHRPLLANFFDTLLGRSSTGATSVNAAPGVRRIAVSLPRPASTRSRSTGLRAHLHEGADPAMVGRGQASCRRPRVASEATTTLAPGQVPPLRLRLRLLRGRRESMPAGRPDAEELGPQHGCAVDRCRVLCGRLDSSGGGFVECCQAVGADRAEHRVVRA